MSLVWRLLPSSALIAGLFISASGCKSGGGLWTPGWAKSGPTTSELAVSRPTTRVPTPSSKANPTTTDSLASTRTAGPQTGPYGAASGPASAEAEAYGSQPADFQGEPHSSVAPAGGYQTGGRYGMASTPIQPGITPGAYAQPSNASANDADYPPGESDPQAGTTAGGYQAAGAADDGAYPDAGATAAAAQNAGSSIYQDPSGGQQYAALDTEGGSSDPSSTASSYGGPTYGSPSYSGPSSTTPSYRQPPPSAPPTTDADIAPPYDETAYGEADATQETGLAANPAELTSPPANQGMIANPYSLPSTAPVAPPATSPSPTTAPATSTAPFTPPTLPSSLSGTPGSYRPGSTASPGSAYGTGYSTSSGTLMR